MALGLGGSSRLLSPNRTTLCRHGQPLNTAAANAHMLSNPALAPAAAAQAQGAFLGGLGRPKQHHQGQQQQGNDQGDGCGGHGSQVGVNGAGWAPAGRVRVKPS